MVNLPPLALFEHPEPASPNGVAVDPRTGDVWFCDFFRMRIGRLRRQ
jgi:streptogramin lyase